MTYVLCARRTTSVTSESGDEKEPQRSPGLPSHEEPSTNSNKSRRSIWRKRLTKVLTSISQELCHMV